MKKNEKILARFALCVICKDKHRLRNINEKINGHLNYLSMISECFKIELKTEQYNFKICSLCIHRLRDACEFKSSVKSAFGLLNLDEVNSKTLETNTQLSPIINDKHDNSVEMIDLKCNINSNTNISLNIESDDLFLKTKSSTGIVEDNDHKNKTDEDNRARISCNMCAKTYITKDSLKIHIRTSHEGIKRFLCKLCMERFSSGNMKNKHMYEVHGWKSRVYPCSSCGKMMYNASQLYMHIESVHQNVKNFTCSVCDKRFYSKRRLKAHEIQHSEEKNFKCDVCSKAFSRKSTLAKHLKIHSDIRDFECEYCGKTYINNWSLKSHLRTHTKTKSVK